MSDSPFQSARPSGAVQVGGRWSDRQAVVTPPEVPFDLTRIAVYTSGSQWSSPRRVFDSFADLVFALGADEPANDVERHVDAGGDTG
jgi:hypothetical protein